MRREGEFRSVGLKISQIRRVIRIDVRKSDRFFFRSRYYRAKSQRSLNLGVSAKEKRQNKLSPSVSASIYRRENLLRFANLVNHTAILDDIRRESLFPRRGIIVATKNEMKTSSGRQSIESKNEERS